MLKMVYGLLFLVLAVGLVKLLHKDAEDVLEQWIMALRIDPSNHYVSAGVEKAGQVSDQKLEGLSALTFGYAALFLTEGMGLFYEKRWAEYLTVIATGSFIPFEIYEVIQHCSALKIALLVVNAGIFIFLIYKLRQPKGA
jgi:uncharacterized membrane protein (DUF2068 family)